LASVYLYAGKSSAGQTIAEKLLVIDPLTPFVHIMKGSCFLDTNIAEGLPYFEKGYEMDPQSPVGKWMLASAYFWCGKNGQGYLLADSLQTILPDWAFTHQLLFLKYGLQGNQQKALEFSAKPELEIEAKNDHHFAFHLAECYAVINEKDKALDLLEYSMQIFFPYKFLSKNILFANIKDEKRFKDLMKEGQQKSEAFEI
jgi:hypothetical protein